MTSFESPKTSTASALASRSNFIPLCTASYLARLLVQGVGNLIEKEYVAPRGETSRIPMLEPSPQTNLSKYIAHARMESAAMSELVLSATRSASACPLTAFAGWYRISNSNKANIHLKSRPFNTGADNICLITSDLQMTIVSVESRMWRSFVQVKNRQRHSFSILGYLVSASNILLLR
jgi:hypothetical protein